MRMKFLLIVACLISSLIGFSESTDTTFISKHLHAIINTPSSRTYQHSGSLNQVANYLYSSFEAYADSTRFQEYDVLGTTYKNVIASFNPQCKKRIIIGAHYDVCGNQDGADDNASGVVGLLEIARLLEGVKLSHRIDLVAYTLEEPPFFRSEQMGSYIHAKSLHDQKVDVVGMVCLEMIGYYSDEPGSQHYPLRSLKLIYGDRGDFITTVKKMYAGNFARKFAKAMKHSELISSRVFKGPKRLAGLDFSDHQNYWKFHYSSVMVTNTSFYRNSNYHQKTDRIETLDLVRMSKVIKTVFNSLVHIDTEMK
jgi:hypothetical protein